MSVQIGREGYFEITYKDFSGGINVQQPETEIPDVATPSANNFQVRNKELRSRPPFTLEFQGMDAINPSLGLFSFLDVNNVEHTVGWNSRGLWQLAPFGQPQGSQFPWSQIPGGPNLTPGVPVSYRTFANVLYYSNGAPFVASWDGIAQAPTASNSAAPGATSVAAIPVADAPTAIPGSTGPLSIGGVFLGELDNHILLANVSVFDNGAGTLYTFPQRLWWAANGIPTQWDFVANTNAGENDFLDVPDAITGLITLGVYGYLFRTNGITFFTPTGNGLAPFQFDHLWASDHGIGNIYPWSIHQYGSIACFVASENIYQMGVSSFDPIGGTARDAIFADLALASGNPVASIVPTENLGYIYLTYRISIPLTTFTRHYIYSIEDKNWMAWDTPNLLVTGRCEEVWTGLLAALPIGAQPPGTGISGGSGGNTNTPTPPNPGSGNQIGCFTGDVKIQTPQGFVRFDELPEKFEIVNDVGTFPATLIVHEDYTDDMLMLETGGLVTKRHGIFKNGDWLPAEEVWPLLPRILDWKGKVYNLHVESDDEDDHYYVLENGAFAHNIRPDKQ